MLARRNGTGIGPGCRASAIILSQELFPEVLPINGAVMDHAKDLVDADQTISARDAVHAAVVVINRLEGICTFDRDFDRIRGCHRVGL